MTNHGDGRPRIALVISALHGISGGAERVLVEVANGLHRRGYPVAVLTYQDHQGPSFYPLDYGILRLDGKPRDGAPSGPAPTWDRSPPRGVWALPTWLVRYGRKVVRLRRLLRIARPDVAIGFLPSSFPYLELAAVGTGIRTIASLHNVPGRELGDDPTRWDQNPVDIALRRRALRTSGANTVPLHSFVEQLEPQVRAKTYVLSNPVPRYEGQPADVADAPTDNTILAVGRLTPAKDHDTLIRAWARLEADHPAWRLRIVGDGPLHGPLTELIEELDLGRAAIDPPTSDIDGVFAAAKFLVMPSVFEGFGLVTAEAMACGLPVIGFADCEGTNELVVDGVNGLLVEPGSERVAALAEAIHHLAAVEADRVRLAEGAPGTLDDYDPAVVLDAWERMIGDVVHGRVPT